MFSVAWKMGAVAECIDIRKITDAIKAANYSDYLMLDAKIDNKLYNTQLVIKIFGADRNLIPLVKLDMNSKALAEMINSGAFAVMFNNIVESMPASYFTGKI
ncbi:hypothetical protein CJD92_22385 [Salmonella enterica subsp. enterica serovar Newport]|nr:hypothetical protein [Salmonella enterica subsp. enterica serovar Newport]